MTLAIAHRGDPIDARENTLPAFASAMRKGADMVELDLRVTRDGEIVVLHDPSLSRLWGVERNVRDLDLAEVQKIGRGDVRIPTLRQVLHHVGIPLMLDLTGSDVVEGALRVVREAGAMARSLFVGGNLGALRQPARERTRGQNRTYLGRSGTTSACAPVRARGRVLEPGVSPGDTRTGRSRARPRLQGLHVDG